MYIGRYISKIWIKNPLQAQILKEPMFQKFYNVPHITSWRRSDNFSGCKAVKLLTVHLPGEDYSTKVRTIETPRKRPSILVQHHLLKLATPLLACAVLSLFLHTPLTMENFASDPINLTNSTYWISPFWKAAKQIRMITQNSAINQSLPRRYGPWASAGESQWSHPRRSLTVL